MIRSASSLGLLILCCMMAQANDDAKSTLVKQKADEIAQAFVKGDCAKIVDLTYPRVIESAGGRARMISAAETVMKQMKERGITYRSSTIGEPSELLTEGGNTFTVLPMTLELNVPGGRVVAKSYLLGISNDDGKSWTFADGNGVDDKEKRDKLLPKLPAKLKLPEKQKPEFIKD